MKIFNYFWLTLKVIKKRPRSNLITAMLTATFVGLASPANATLITINAIAPSQQALNVAGGGVSLSGATDFCIGAIGDGMGSGTGVGSAIVGDYSMTPGGGFTSSQNASGGGLGLVDGGIAVSDWKPDIPVNSPEAICFDFPEDPVDPNGLFSAVVDANWLEDSDFDFNDIYNLSGLLTDECYLSYHTDDDGNDISPVLYFKVDCDLTRAPPSMVFARPAGAEVIFDDGNVRRYRVVSTPSMSMMTVLFLGGLFIRRTFKNAKKLGRAWGSSCLINKTLK